MSKISNRIKKTLLKSMEALGKSASNMANNAHDRLSEINMETRRREIISEFPVRAFDLWQNGAEFPEPLNSMFEELSELEQQLSILRAQRYAKVPEAQSVSIDDAISARQEVGETAEENETDGTMQIICPEERETPAEAACPDETTPAEGQSPEDDESPKESECKQELCPPEVKPEGEASELSDEEPGLGDSDVEPTPEGNDVAEVSVSDDKQDVQTPSEDAVAQHSTF